MARRRAIIRKLPAVETLGSTTVICSDKTGTLTENQMTVQAIHAGGVLYAVTGSGYEPSGEILDPAGRAVDPASRVALIECLRAGLLCNDAQLVREQEHWTVQGDPTEAALIVVAEKAGLAHVEVDKRLPRLDAIPFESEHQFMATLHGGGKSGHVIYKKGAVERLLDRCTTALGRLGGARWRSTTMPYGAQPTISLRAACACSPSPAAWLRTNQHRVEHRHVAAGAHLSRAAGHDRSAATGGHRAPYGTAVPPASR